MSRPMGSVFIVVVSTPLLVPGQRPSLESETSILTVGSGFSLLLTASAPRKHVTSQLSRWPPLSPLNNSAVTLRSPSHHSGPVGASNPLPYDCLIRYTSPVYPGTQGV